MIYDFAILGGGAAGLSLALALADSPLRDRSILIVEKEAKNTNDRTWCYWTDQATALDGIVHHVWPRLSFFSSQFERSYDLQPFRYQMIRGLDFYNHARAGLSQLNVTFVRGSGEVTDGDGYASVQVDGAEYLASWVFDSRFFPGENASPPSRNNFLLQHFLGWRLETETDVFDPLTATIFDLRTPPQPGISFFYVLPFSEREAMVEYTLFSTSLLPRVSYAHALNDYLLNRLKVGHFRVVDEEFGVIPMTDLPFPRCLGKRIMAIGTRGGRVKPSTGYAFSRIQRDSQAIVRSLLATGKPYHIPSDSLRHRFYDMLMLEVMAKQSDRLEGILSAMFKRNPVQRVLRFLDDRSGVGEDLALIASLPALPFLKALKAQIFKSLLPPR